MPSLTVDLPSNPACESGTLFSACLRHLDVEVALKLRAELLACGWQERQLLEYSQQLLTRLPPLVDVLADTDKWAALGVFPAADIRSEQSQLMLNLPCYPEGCVVPADPDDPSAQRGALVAQEEGGSALKAAVKNVQPAERVAEAGASAKPASVAQEIFERKGWNDMDSSGWKPWMPW